MEFDIPITEDLMREHGLLNRLLLIYEKLISCKNLDYELTFITAILIRSFIEDYHEKMEEDYIFPLFNNEMTNILKEQHQIGRKLTDVILENSQKEINPDLIKENITKFIFMYRAHESREDTEIFEKVREKISKEQFEKISDISEELEIKNFGENGYQKILKEVIKIEKKLGVNSLDYYSDWSHI